MIACIHYTWLKRMEMNKICGSIAVGILVTSRCTKRSSLSFNKQGHADTSLAKKTVCLVDCL